MGSVAIGKIATGETFMVSQVDGGPVGETTDPLVVGDAVFFSYWNGSTTSSYVYKDNLVRLFVGRPAHGRFCSLSPTAFASFGTNARNP